MPNFPELIKTKEYADGRGNVAGWKKRLGRTDAKGALEVKREKDAFFSAMRTKTPDLYALFKVEDKLLSEKILKKLTGREIIID